MIKNLILTGILSLAITMAFAQGSSQSKATSESTTPITKIEFQESVFEFGEVIEGEKIKNVFTFTNTGTQPLIISNAKGSCGCTVPSWPKEPIMPGESADLLVQFDSKGKGKVGGNLQSKRVTITANTDPAVSYLTIKGSVNKLEDRIKSTIGKSDQEINNDFNPDIDSEKVVLFPNPTYDELTVSLEEYAGNSGSIEIYNGAGAKVDERAVVDYGDNQLFNVSEYTPGIYTVSIKLEGKNRIAKRFTVTQK